MRKVRIMALVMAALMVLALFSGCNKTETPAPAATNAPAGSSATATPAPTAAATQKPAETAAPAATDAPAPEETEEPSPYHFAKGKVAVDAKGMPLEKFNYELPLSTTDEEFSVWTTLYTPQWLETEYEDSPYPIELEHITGVHAAYQVVSSATRSDNFSVMLAADELPDIMSQANYFYNGDFRKGITEEGFFVNLYDWREYIPNYLYEVNKSPDDEGLQASVYLEDDLIGCFYTLRDRAYVQNGVFVRGDWVDQLGLDPNMFKTWQGVHDGLAAFKSQIPTATYPCILFTTLEAGGYHWDCFDTYCYTSSNMMNLVDENGKIFSANTTERDKALMTDINAWFMEGLFDPMWMSFDSMTAAGYMDRWVGDQIGYSVQSTSTGIEQEIILDDPNAKMLPMPDPVLYEGQVLHVGTNDSRLYYGSGSVSAKCENIPLALTWIDWRYSEEGSDFCTMGVEEYGFVYNEKGEKRVSEFVRSNPLYVYSMHILLYALNSMVDPGLDKNYQHYWYDGGDRIIETYDTFAEFKKTGYDGAFMLPRSLTLTDDERSTASSLAAELATYISENYLAFVDGSKPLSEWDSYVDGLETIGLSEYQAIYQAAYERVIAG